ncbi:MAG: hypothetical protein DHS20C17_26030 [Cyclobacteriaceae bacterium]|nr:MAG: hypothetical protein DHS20C17_26030 [Cyclobacteriaceae bacterium]
MVFDPVEETIMQWKNQTDGCDVGSPPFSIRVSDDNIKYNIKYDQSTCTTTPTTVYGNINKSLTRGVWHHFVVEIHYDYRVTNGEGHVKIWYSEEDPVTTADSVLNYQGPVGYNDQLWPYLKVGIYKSEWKILANRTKSIQAGVTERKMWIDQVGVIEGPWAQVSTANAGHDKTIILPNNEVTLNGSASVPNGFVSSYQWTQQAGPNDADLIGSDSSSLKASNLIEGSYVFRLSVTDDEGVLANDDVSVIVKQAPNQEPIVNAGPDKTITLPQNNLTLDGSGSDPDGSIVSFQWVQVSGPSNATLTKANTEDPEVSDLIQGTYVFKLTATDNDDVSASEEMSVKVEQVSGQEPPNTEPKPSVDASITHTKCNSNNGAISLTVTGSTGPFKYSWSTGATTKDVAQLAHGNYQVTITDQNGATVNETFTVNASKGNLILAAEIDHTSCLKDDGAIRVTASGGTAPYSFEWSNGENTPNIQHLASGDYNLVVVDKNGCRKRVTFEVPVEPAQTEFELNSEVKNTGCNGRDGSISLEVLDDNGPYTYSWSNGATGPNLSGLGLGVYQVRITDKHGCFMKENFIVYQNPIAVPVIIKSGDSLLVEEQATHYQWYKDGIVLEGSTSNSLKVHETGSYTVQISEDNCTNISEPFVAEDIRIFTQDNYTFEQVDIFPNPVVSHMTVEIHLNGSAPTSLAVYDFQGTILHTQDLGVVTSGTISQLDVSDLTSGIYFIKIASAHEVVSRKFIKK